MQDFSIDISPDDIEHQKQIARDTLERYSGSPIDAFQSCLLLTNFPRYVDHFAETYDNAVSYEGTMFKVAHAPDVDISILDFKIGSPAAALILNIGSDMKKGMYEMMSW